MVKFEGDYIILTSGKRIYANRHIVEIAVTGDFGVIEGYDGGIISEFNIKENDKEFECLTKDEIFELADLMIKRWQEFKVFVEKEITND